MRGIETALAVWERVQRGEFASEALRKVSEEVKPSERVLAATLVYSLFRRKSLWQEFMNNFLKPSPNRFSKHVRDAIIVGSAGLMELKNFAPPVLINSLIEWTKERDPRGASVVNAVLRKVLENGDQFMKTMEEDDSVKGLCRYYGLQDWVGHRLIEQYGPEEGKELIKCQSDPTAMALRLSPGINREVLIEKLNEAGISAEPSPLVSESLRLNSSSFPPGLPGYEEGWFTPQSESAMIISRVVSACGGERILDMCMGRGVKAGHMAQLMPSSLIEGWDLSQGRISAAKRDLERLGLSARVSLCHGDALELKPRFTPDIVLLDAPCSGSGTWRKHPEGKWKLTRNMLGEMVFLQKKLLKRALSLVSDTGYVVYTTCSILREENENVVLDVLRSSPEFMESDFTVDVNIMSSLKSSTAGYLIPPSNLWNDGFYFTVLRRK